MEIAHILVTCEDESEDDVFEEIKSIKEIKEIKKTFGVYNAVIRVEAESVQKIKKIMVDKIRNRPDILHIDTGFSIDF